MLHAYLSAGHWRCRPRPQCQGFLWPAWWGTTPTPRWHCLPSTSSSSSPRCAADLPPCHSSVMGGEVALGWNKWSTSVVIGCRILNSRRLRCTQNFDTTFYKILNAIGDICVRTCCHEVLCYVAKNFLQFHLSQCLCTRYHDVGSDKNKNIFLLCQKWTAQLPTPPIPLPFSVIHCKGEVLLYLNTWCECRLKHSLYQLDPQNNTMVIDGSLFGDIHVQYLVWFLQISDYNFWFIQTCF